MKALKLKYPIMINGEEKKEIKYDFEELTVNDFIEAEKRMLGKGQVSMTLEEMNYSWHACIFAAAAAKANPGTDMADYFRVKGSDALEARRVARDFLLAAEGGEENSLEPQP